MTTTAMKAKTIRVKIEEGKTGLFFATSPDLRGLLAAESTIDGLHSAIEKAIVDLYEASGVRVVVSMLDSKGDDFEPWVAFLTDAARGDLSKLPA